MTNWEQKIIDVFISRYFESVPETGTERGVLRLRSQAFFPGFDTAAPDEKESYLEAAESLERRGIVKLRWEKRDKGERLKTLSCENFEKLFAEAGRPYPKTEAEQIRTMLGEKVVALKKTQTSSQAEKIIELLEYFSVHFSPRETAQGIDPQTMREIIKLLEFLLDPAGLENITTRALSILLYRDSKRLEFLLALCNALIAHSQITGLDLFFLERSKPDTMISGKIILEHKDANPPLVNATGMILGLPLESAEAISVIQPITAKTEKIVLTIENKETFYVLGSPQKHNAAQTLFRRNPYPLRYDCFLYTGGYPNSAVTSLIKTLAASGFSFHHAGDLDPDGVLILQHIQSIAGKPVTPLRMDAATFDAYLSWARPLPKTTLLQIKKIHEETKAIPELAGLLRRIEETGMGVEQEIIDYR